MIYIKCKKYCININSGQVAIIVLIDFHSSDDGWRVVGNKIFNIKTKHELFWEEFKKYNK